MGAALAAADGRVKPLLIPRNLGNPGDIRLVNAPMRCRISKGNEVPLSFLSRPRTRPLPAGCASRATGLCTHLSGA
jgi:hypothetical protein